MTIGSRLGRSGLAMLTAAVVLNVPALASSELDHDAVRGNGPGRDAPAIVLRAPSDGGVYASPVGVDIGFEPGRDAAIDLSTLKVTVVTHTLFGDLSFDITDDVDPFVSLGGIHARDARIPAGEHTVTISIADTLQRQARQELRITVRDQRGSAVD